MYTRRLVLFVVLVAMVGVGAQPREEVSEDPVELPRFVVKESGIVYLQMSFRSHLFFRGFKTLTFRSVPKEWQRVGIEIGDEIVSINGEKVYGMGLKRFFDAGKERLRPLREDPPKPASTVFEIKSVKTGRVWKYEFSQTVEDCIVYGTPKSI